MEQTPDDQVNEVLEPAEQQTILFYDKPLIVVRLPNGEPGAVLRYFCDNLGLAQNRQIDRIKRKKALAAGLHYARIETAGGPQVLAVLTLRVVPGWLFGIDTNRVKPELQPEIERYQAECVDVLYQWASTPRIEAPAGLVPAKPIVKPEAPEQGASPQEWRLYHQRMIEFLDWQESIEAWRSSVDTRLGNLEAIVPDILQRIGPARITTEHQTLVQFYVSKLHEITKKPHETLYAQLKTAFRVPRYDEIPEADWPRVEQWFRLQFPGQTLPESTTQGDLF